MEEQVVGNVVGEVIQERLLISEKEDEKARMLAERFLVFLREAGGEAKIERTEHVYIVRAIMPERTFADVFMRRNQGLSFYLLGKKEKGLELDAKELPNRREIFSSIRHAIHHRGSVEDEETTRLPDGSTVSVNEFHVVGEIASVEVVIHRDFGVLMIVLRDYMDEKVSSMEDERERIFGRCLSCTYFVDCLFRYYSDAKWFFPVECRSFKRGEWTRNLLTELEKF